MPVARARQYRPPVDVDAYLLYGATRAPNYFGDTPADYYTKGTKFDWLAQDVGTATFSTQEGTRSALAAALAARGYSVTVNYGTTSWWDFLTSVWVPGYVLEVTGSQNSDRQSWNHIRDEITQAAQDAGFSWSAPLLFNVEQAGSPFHVGSTGSDRAWGDKTPVEVRSLFSELPDVWGSVIAPALQTNWPILAIAAVALLAALGGGRK